MAKQKWQSERVIGKHRVYARRGHGEIIVRVENDGDTTKYAEWGLPTFLGLDAAMEQASAQTTPDRIVP